MERRVALAVCNGADKVRARGGGRTESVAAVVPLFDVAADAAIRVFVDAAIRVVIRREARFARAAVGAVGSAAGRDAGREGAGGAC